MYVPRSEVHKQQLKLYNENHYQLTTANFEDVKTTVTIQMADNITVASSPRNIAAAPLTAATIPSIDTAIFS